MNGWRVEVPAWTVLPRSMQRSFIKIVGEWSGEWWGDGRGEFTSSVLAEGCAREVMRDLKQRATFSFWVRPNLH